ncbi:hypothetical protein LNA02_03890 [Levilactobacillus namurensis]|nr:hypothetical protein LNA02_03890 [Levilactobacillus namurensis]
MDQLNLDEDLMSVPQFFRVDFDGVLANHATVFQLRNASGHGRWGQMDQLSKVVLGDATISVKVI